LPARDSQARNDSQWRQGMYKSRAWSIAGTGFIAIFAACGAGSSAPGSTSSGTGLASCLGTITVATDLPLTGGDATDGPPVEEAAHLAVTQANANKTLGGCTLRYESKNDATVAENGNNPAQGAANIAALAADTSVVGVVGPFDPDVAEAEIPVASKAHLPLISPSNTNPGLTQPGSYPSIDTSALYAGGVHSYFRTIPTDTGQGQILAYVAYHELRAKDAYVFDDQETYGQGLASFFTTDFAKYGGTVVGSASLPGSTTNFSQQLADAKSKGAQVIFFGGTSSNGCGLLRSQMPAAGLSRIPELGGDGCQDAEFITDAGSAAPGSEVTSAPDISKLASSAQFYKDFRATYHEDATESPYTPYSYDAMNALIRAIKSTLEASGGQPPSDSQTFRDDVIAQLHQISYQGATGTITFDANGDTTNIEFSLNVISGGTWTAKENLVLRDGTVFKAS
jgi:branched-chain amino acid transport system substrate-binding protein